MANGALAGVRVVEWGDFVSAPFCGKVLAELGADVIKIEAPGLGDSSRRHGPFPGDVPHPERSGLFLLANLNKRSVTLDLGTASGWAYCQDVGGRYVGSVLGWGNMWGNLGATVSPILLAWVFTSYGFDVMFYVCAGAFCFAGLCGLGIDATIPIAPPDEDEELQPNANPVGEEL